MSSATVERWPRARHQAARSATGGQRQGLPDCRQPNRLDAANRPPPPPPAGPDVSRFPARGLVSRSGSPWRRAAVFSTTIHPCQPPPIAISGWLHTAGSSRRNSRISRPGNRFRRSANASVRKFSNGVLSGRSRQAKRLEYRLPPRITRLLSDHSHARRRSQVTRPSPNVGQFL